MGAFAGVLKDFSIEDKILSITCDNASKNDAMVKQLDDTLTKFAAVNCTHSFAHIVNLVVKSLLKTLT